MRTALLTGFALGWSVAWPPGPINAEAIRRALAHRAWAAYAVVLGGCAGDATWALVAGTGAARLRGPRVQLALEWISVALLLVLACWFFYNAAVSRPAATSGRPAAGSFALGLTFALTSPWNLAFWTAVMAQSRITASSPLVAAGVIAGAATWGAILCFGIGRLARVVSDRRWEIFTQLATGALMLFFAVRTFLNLS
jgi:threonine/homoserine/homoserine lactone efflux protein